MIQVFNSEFEISMRILLLLSTFNEPLNAGYIKSIDLLSIYSKQYGISDTNLHGDSSYSFSEVASRHDTIANSLKSLVKSNLINVRSSSEGFVYQINENGIECCKQMKSDYAIEYKQSVIKTKVYISGKSLKEIHNLTYGQLKRRAE